MFNLGFNGQFGGGFMQASEAGVAAAPPGSITYAINWTKSQPRDDSQRRDRYGSLDRWQIAFPTSPGQQPVDESMKTTFPAGPVTFSPGATWRQRRYR